MTRPRYYTEVPRPVLWLVQGGTVELGPGALPVEVAPFYLSTVPVTNRQLEACAPEFDRSPWSRDDDGPALGVGFDLAQRYCAWYADVSRKPMRLPTEIEWEYACRVGVGGGPLAPDRIWSADNSPADRVPDLTALPSNDVGLYGLLGGVWDWTTVRDQPDQGVLRGGSFRTPLDEIGWEVRRASPELVAEAGFRVAKSLRG